jgi:hypothetical protein
MDVFSTTLIQGENQWSNSTLLVIYKDGTVKSYLVQGTTVTLVSDVR